MSECLDDKFNEMSGEIKVTSTGPAEHFRYFLEDLDGCDGVIYF